MASLLNDYVTTRLIETMLLHDPLEAPPPMLLFITSSVYVVESFARGLMPPLLIIPVFSGEFVRFSAVNFWGFGIFHGLHWREPL
jgi:hypothetical protein